MKKKFLTSVLCAVAVMLSTLLWVETANALTVTVNNKGDKALFICFVYSSEDGIRMARGWWKVEANTSRAINLGNGYIEHFGKTFLYHAYRGKTTWGNGSGSAITVTNKAFNYSDTTGSPDGPNPRHVKSTEVTYKGDKHTLTFN